MIHKNVNYNCRVIIHNKKILLIRPKMWLANDGNYRELRYFTPWTRHRQWEDHYLPRIIQAVTGQVRFTTDYVNPNLFSSCSPVRQKYHSETQLSAPLTLALVSNSAKSSSLPQGEPQRCSCGFSRKLIPCFSPHILMGLDGVEIFTNSSGSHHELRKLHRRIDLIKEATQKVGSLSVLSITPDR